MSSMRRLTAAEQTAAHLREEISGGRLQGRVAGVAALAARLDVSPTSVRAALNMLEVEKIIGPGGPGRSRMVIGSEASGGQRKTMRVLVLLGDRISNMDAGFQSLLFNLQHDLELAGHSCVFSSKLFPSQESDLRRLADFVAETKADAWVIIGGEHRILQWFSQQEIPVIALGGRCLELPIASTGMATLDGFRDAIRHLLALGHRRIVFLTPRFFRDPEPGPTVLAFQQELARCGVTATNYHLPDWDETPEGASRLIKSLLQVTPPTAFVTTFTNWMTAVISALGKQGFLIPHDASVFCMNRETWFPWHSPLIGHLFGDETPMVKRIVRWVNQAERGKADKDYVSFPLEFLPGDSMGPPPR